LETSDYLWHLNAKIEWKYLWGRLSDGRFFHYVEFRKGDEWFRHYSLDGKFYEDEISNLSGFGFKTPQFDLQLVPQCEPIVHNTKTRNYYSIPHLTGTSRYNDNVAEAWYDQEWDFTAPHAGSDWEWFSLKLNCGMSIVAYNREEDKYCDFNMGDKTVQSEFLYDYPKHFYINALGSYLTLEPFDREVIFRPKHGRPYSETPFKIIAKGAIIGIGVRERTYKENN